MNSVNQMVSDLKNRMNDGSEANLVKKNQKKIKKKFPWSILLVLLSVTVGALTSINYFNILDEDKKTAQIKRQNIQRDSTTSVVINTIPDDKKVNVVQKLAATPLQMDEDTVVISKVQSPKNNIAEEKPIAEKDMVLANQQERKIEKPKPIVKARVDSPKISTPPKKESKPTVAEKVVKATTIKPNEVPVTLTKVEKSKAEVKVEKPVKATFAKVEVPKSKPIEKQEPANKPKIPMEVKPKVPPKRDVAKAVEEPVAEKNVFNKTPIPLTNSELAETIYQRGIALLEQGEVERANALFVKTLKEYPPHLKATEALVGIYSNQQNWARAIETLKSGIEANRKNVSLTMWLAQIYLQQERMSEALDLLKKNEKYAKGNGEYFALLAVTYQNVEQFEFALSSYEKALKVDNSSSRWWFGMAIVLELQNNFSDAQVAYSQALNTGQLPEELISYAEQRLEHVSSQN